MKGEIMDKSKEQYITLVKGLMERGESVLATRREIYKRYLLMVAKLGETNLGRAIVDELTTTSYITNDMYMGLGTLILWAEGSYFLEPGLEESLWEGLSYIATGDPQYTYSIEERVRVMADEKATQAIGEDLSYLLHGE